MKELVESQSNDTFCSTMFKLINDRKVPSDKYLISDNGLLPKFVRENDKLFHALVVPITFSKYVLYQVHDTLGHSGTGIACLSSNNII